MEYRKPCKEETLKRMHGYARENGVLTATNDQNSCKRRRYYESTYDLYETFPVRFINLRNTCERLGEIRFSHPIKGRIYCSERMISLLLREPYWCHIGPSLLVFLNDSPVGISGWHVAKWVNWPYLRMSYNYH
ncbi:hypothetical protein J6590_102024 [Homalodisca vitripennis]|nr:hypothetical protein J6590_102024 [Homalodisca vitripennis]